MSASPHILVFGAAGLIGEFLAADLARRGFVVTAVARRFTAAQRAGLGSRAREAPLMALDTNALTQLIRAAQPDVIVNCIGVLQDSGDSSTQDVHVGFVERLLVAIRATERPVLLIHFSIPGTRDGDGTPFARTKRAAEQRIAEAGLPYAIFRPGFVVAPRAYGGSAMVRALAALPLGVPPALGGRPFSYVAVEDVATTVATLAERWSAAGHHAVLWDVMHPDPSTLSDVIAAFRQWLSADGPWRLTPPMVLLRLGALLGDLSARLGWRPPLRSTALAELQRGVAGDPASWLAATQIAPSSLRDILMVRAATVQDIWFARLFLLKPLIVASLVVFWSLSGLIALTVAFNDATGILLAHGMPVAEAKLITVISSCVDISVGTAIAFRRTCRAGLLAGMIVSLGYMLGAAWLTPELWIEPLGALVKTGPSIVLMLVAWAVLPDR